MIRVVVDTNVLVSAIRRGTTTRQVAEAWMAGRARLLISKEIVQEYLRVLSYPKLHLAAEEVRGVLEQVVLPYADVVRSVPRLSHRTISQDDLQFLACSVAGEADYLITGDQQLLKLGRFHRVEIVSPAHFLNILSLL